MTAYDTWIKQGIEKGMEKGLLKGKIEVIINGWKNGLSIDILSNITGLSEEKVKQILKDNGLVN